MLVYAFVCVCVGLVAVVRSPQEMFQSVGWTVDYVFLEEQGILEIIVASWKKGRIGGSSGILGVIADIPHTSATHHQLGEASVQFLCWRHGGAKLKQLQRHRVL